MKTSAQLAESIARFRQVFWDKRSAGRPPVAVVDPDVFLPIKFLRRAMGPTLAVADVAEGTAATEYEFSFARSPVTCDDGMPFSAAWRGIPWLEAACGCPVRYASGSLAPGHFVRSVGQLAERPIPADPAWLDCLRRETQRLVGSAPADCWVSPTILRGPSDVLAAMRGLSEFYCDLYDDIDAVGQAAGRVNRLLLDVLDMHHAAVPPKHGGYAHIFGYWAPARTIVIQEDVLGMCAPAVYRDHFLRYSAQVVEHVGPHVLFHLHSTGYRHWRDCLSVPGIAGLELTLETNGPALRDLVPVLREILERSRLILMVDAWFEQLPDALRRLPREGLYVILRTDQVRSNDEFRHFLQRQWPP